MKKGALFEKQVVEYLQSCGLLEARRAGSQGAMDKGDVLGLPLPITLELKNQTNLSIGTWMTELQKEMGHAGTEVGAVVHKRRGVQDPSSQYVTMDLLSFVQLMLWAWKG